METICILVVIDVETAITSISGTTTINGTTYNIMTDGLYLVDTTGYVGSTSGEGTLELKTTCSQDQELQWSIQPIDPNSSASITGFVGTAFAPNNAGLSIVGNPVKDDSDNKTQYYKSTVASNALQIISDDLGGKDSCPGISPALKDGKQIGYQVQYSITLKIGKGNYIFDPYLIILNS